MSSQQITLRSLLEEMTDRDALARWPVHAYIVKQASSYDRHRIAPDKPGWFDNADSSNYIWDETNQGRQERVLMDAEGPGALVRFFLTSAGSRKARIRVYLDRSASPALEWPEVDLMSGDLKIDAPILSRHPAPLDHGGATLYLPIPYAKHCKVTLEEADPAHAGLRYYHIDYRTYAKEAQVETFTRTGLDQDRQTIDRSNRLLTTYATPRSASPLGFDKTLKAGNEESIDLPTGPMAVRRLELTIGADLPPAAREQALRSIVLRASFDDEADAIWCPVGDFTGSGAGGRPISSWQRTVDERGNAVCRWTMPYKTRARLTLQNLGNQPVKVKLNARVGSWAWDDRSMIFHSTWHQQTQIPARPFRDWNFVTVAGRGVMVGDVMSVYNPIPSWYGEGNEKIWVDGESFPSHIGTGTEDYYNASWAPNPVFQTPFANHPRMDEPLSQGQNVYTRTRSLDIVPFEKSLKFDFEIITWNDSQVDYAATTYWYGSPGARATQAPQTEEARRPVPALPAPAVLQGALECEDLPIVARSPGLLAESQDMRYAQGFWSNSRHLLIRGTKSGEFVEIAIPVKSRALQRVTLYPVQAYDYGILKFSVNGQPVSEVFDGYTPLGARVTAPLPLGVFTPVNGKLILRAELIGTNPKSGGVRYLAALDAVVLSER